MLRAAFDPNHLAVAAAEVNLAHAFIRSGNLPGAQVLLEHSTSIEENVTLAGPNLAMCLFVEAEWNAGSGHTAQADQLFGKSIAMFEAAGWANDPFIAEVLLAYAKFSKPHRRNDAAALKRRAEAIRSLRP